MQADFEAQNPQKVRFLEVKARHKKNPNKKQTAKNQATDEMESDDSDLEQWINKQSLGFLGSQREWGNQEKGKQWVQVQKQLQRSHLIKESQHGLFKQHKITYLQAEKESPSLGTTAEQKEFQDMAFPAIYQSITGEWGVMKKYQEVYWERASRKISQCVIFQEKIMPQSLRQGKLGDCYFLSSLAALAERPDRIFNVFLTNELNAEKRFSVKVLFKGRWQVVDIDDYFPFLKDKPVFSRSNNRELWVMILEKVWAKIYGSYMNISAGQAQECLHDFTGAPIKFFKLKNNKDLDKEQVWKYLLKASKREYAMCASSNAGSDTKMSQTGIVQGHCYTLLNATYLKFKDKKIRLLQLRNPWGRKEGQSQWSDRDPQWKEVSEKEKTRLGFSKNSKDGIFFMDFDEFLNEYRAITIAEINDNCSYVYETAKDPNCQGVCFKLYLNDTARYSFQIAKTPKRSFSVKDRTKYRYPKAYCKVFNGNPPYDQIHNFYDDERLTSRKYTMKKGVYYAIVKIDFDTKLQKHFDVTLALYAEADCKISLASIAQRKKLGVVEFSHDKIEIKKKRYKSTPKLGDEEPTQLKGGKFAIKFTYNTNSSSSVPSPIPQPIEPIAMGNNVQIKNKRETVLVPKQQEKISEIKAKDLVKIISQLDWVKAILKRQNGQITKAQVVDMVQNIKKQLVYLQPSPAQERLQQLRKQKKEFIDERFPPNLTSLNGEWGFIEEWKNVRWERISKMLPRANIFREKISPLSIKQGFLGDCYFLAGLAALAEKPQRILNLFLLTQRNELNYYSVKLLYRGKWLTVDMDDYLPYMYDQPAFSNTSNGQLWVVLLQKAWAKVYSSYKRIQAGFPEETLHDLTGAPIKHIYIQRGPFDPEKEWVYLMKASQLQYAMVASSQVGSDSLKSVSGIVQGHAYTLLGVYEIDFHGKKNRLVQLRNPWGKGQGVASWSDADTNWNLISQNQKKRIGYVKKDDGVFFLAYQLFCKEFKLITIAQINDNASFTYLSAKDREKQGCFFTATVHKKGRYSFQVDNTPERTFENRYHTDYKYPQTSFEMGMITDKGYIRKMVGLFANARTLFHTADLQAGSYVCFVRTDYDLKFQKDFSINLAVYGDYPCLIELSTNKEAVTFTNNPNVRWPRQDKSKNIEWNSLRGYNRARIRTIS